MTLISMYILVLIFQETLKGTNRLDAMENVTVIYDNDTKSSKNADVILIARSLIEYKIGEYLFVFYIT